MITNFNKAETAGGGYNDLFVMQIRPRFHPSQK